jgi:hypothetical protein
LFERRKRTAGILVFFTLIVPLSLFAQVPEPKTRDQKEFVIEDVVYNISGLTWERILAKRADIKKGKTFTNLADLEAYLADRRQVIINQRVLAEADLTYTTRDLPDGNVGVLVSVNTKDTWNIVLLPYLKYDSNTGLLLSLRGRDFNFLGSMETLKLDLDYLFNPDTKEHEFGQELAFVLPFRFVNYDWRFGLEEGLTYNASEDDYEFRLISSVSIDLPFYMQDWTLSFSQGYFYNDSDSYGDTSYHQSKAAFGTEFELPYEFGHLGVLKYKPQVFTQVKYHAGRDLSEERRGVEPGFTHELFVERIDWIGNFRDGAYISLGNTDIYNLRDLRWKNSLNWKVVGHKAFPWIGLSGRLSGFLQFDKELGVEEDDNVGEPIRGILDDRLMGDAGIFLNTDFLLKMWLWKLDKVFEVQAGPFIDMALVKRKGESFNLGDLWYGGGVQVLVFPKFARSLYIRASLGFDLEAVLEDGGLSGSASRDGKKKWEMFIGLGHHY